MNPIPENYKNAIEWIDEQLTKPNQYDINLGGGIIIDNLHNCLITKKERLVNLSAYNQKIVFLQTKLIKDYLNATK
jgi:hypothetical protein